MLKNQKFGVEIEFTGITRRKAAGIVARTLGVAIPNADSSVYKTRTIVDTQGRKWKVMRDSSIVPMRSVGEASDEYRVEFVTPPLRYEDIETVQEIVRAFRKAGAVANHSCGIHIHIDGANHNAQSLRRLVKFFSARQQLVYEALQVSTERANSWCKPVAKSLIDEMAKVKNISRTEMETIWYSRANDNYSGRIDHSHYNHTRYHGLNLHSFFSKGTVEFRLFNSTLHAGKIKAYIQFCLAISAWAIESNDRCSFRAMDGFDARLRRDMMMYILRDKCKLVGAEFATARKWLMEGFETATAAA
jgi:hypothetical protein